MRKKSQKSPRRSHLVALWSKFWVWNAVTVFSRLCILSDKMVLSLFANLQYRFGRL